MTFRMMLAPAAAAASAGAAPMEVSRPDARASGRDAIELSGTWSVAPKEWGASNVVWRSFTTAVLQEWDGRRVFVEIPGALHKCDAVVWVNGEKAGDILRPGVRCR